jgi:hypothetical protein
MTNTTIANHGCCQQKWPPSTPHKALRSMPTHRMDSRQCPKQADVIFGLLRVCMALKTLQCCGNASLPEQRSALRAIHTLYPPLPPPPNYTRYLGGLSSIHLTCQCRVQGLMWGAGGSISAGGGHGCGGCDVSCVLLQHSRSQNHFGPIEPQQIGYCHKVLNVTKAVISLYWGHNLGMNKVERNH